MRVDESSTGQAQTTPTLGTIDLVDGARRSGAAFPLAKPATESIIMVVGDWEVEVSKGNQFVLARGGAETNYEDAVRIALLSAQRGLDGLSITGGTHLVIKSFESEHLVWWREASDTVIRLTMLADIGIEFTASGEVRDAAGNIVPPPIPRRVTPWNESFRYFRLSQTTDDLFDAYRNAYLALESVLSQIYPHIKGGEGVWFKEALGVALPRAPTIDFIPQGTSDPVDYLYNELYKNMRSAMSHAKSGRTVLLPQDEGQRTAVTESLQRLVTLYLALADDTFGIKLRPAVFYPHFFQGIQALVSFSWVRFRAEFGRHTVPCRVSGYRGQDHRDRERCARIQGMAEGPSCRTDDGRWVLVRG